MNKFLVFLLTVGLTLSGVGTYKLYKMVMKDKEMLHLDIKFGTAPKNPKYNPIVHLANAAGQPFCTAFVIDANFAATAAHCIDGTGKLPVEKFRFLDENGNDLGVSVSAAGYHEQTDLGLLMGDFNNFYQLKSDFRNSGFIPGVPMKACGYPFGLTWLSLQYFRSS